MGKRRIQKSLNIFTSRVKKVFRPTNLILFGSYASGDATEYSDIDILVVAEKMADIPYEKRIDVLYELTRDLRPDFHVYGLTPKEYTSTSSLTIVEEIKRNGMNLI